MKKIRVQFATYPLEDRNCDRELLGEDMIHNIE